MKLISGWLRIPFWQRVVAGFVLGALVGWVMGPAAKTWFGPLGTLYVTLIKMIAIPLVFFAVINAIAALHGQRSVAMLGGRTFLWFIVTAVLAVCVGLGVGTLLKPGNGDFTVSVDAAWAPPDVPSPVHVLLDVVPSNPFYALTGIGTRSNNTGETTLAAGRGSILPVIFFAALLGLAIVKLGERVTEVRKLIGQMSEIMIQITRFVLEMTPLGTFGLIAALVGSYGFQKLLPFGHFVLALYLACTLHIVVVYSGLLLAHGLSPLKFFRGVAPGMQVAFVSSSSFAAMPVALRAITHNLGVNKDYAAFAVPLGSSIKMDGCGAIFPALCAVFIAQYTGVPLTTNQYFVIFIASVLGSFGTAGVPGTAVVMATVVLSAAHLPLEVIGYLYAIDRVLDMMRTMTNVTGQMLVPVLVAKETGLLNTAVYEAASSNVGIGTS
ncbi:dicarboxylate/amino acid:cation symporter [Xylella fastidiosa]|nr:dicarboxylate/amino acid:cation symporter [Xylella fastidiosa]KFA41474.1 glutamate symporter [Xylella fastidiosa]MDD0909025.1 dicarboxylate/amino acid:cation symporter [Xylella fastidiosa subsp. multiplex]MDD0941869.1 dicarboxylate/amino acid:cation symporter [Xylella fastidiosa subsp. multiplex]MDS9989093.1 dicarboxylate/amino acid:cation symporter [Xylella fastidiosa]QTX29439.1 dicarboxylate/amino acid:cation symporter [Xylella fastidiosa subsp. multiplex]